MPVRKRKQKGLWVSNFSLLLVVFKRHYGNEGVKGLLGRGPRTSTSTFIDTAAPEAELGAFSVSMEEGYRHRSLQFARSDKLTCFCE